MKFLVLLLFQLSIITYIPAQTVEDSLKYEGETGMFKQFIPAQEHFSDNSGMSLKEKFLALNDNYLSNNEKEKNSSETDGKAEAQINYAKTQSDGFKFGSEVYYFLGAAAVAAIIYFLVPDDEPPSKPNYTFGFPVTPN